jgi:uncharacterized repeat protein (TIGR03803 family)
MLAITLVALSSAVAHGQTLTVLHSFVNGQDGIPNASGVVIDRGGNVYGTATFGGNRGPSCDQGGCGAVYRASLKNGSWIFTPLYDFVGNQDGSQPYAGVTIGPDGALYGTTLFGGGGGGTVFKLTPPARLCHQVLCPWTETVLYRFATDPNGLNSPYGGVIFDAAGNMYGMTGFAAGGPGAVYKMTRSGQNWILSVLHVFQQDTDGAVPQSNLSLGSDGNLYGSAPFGGANSNGTIFRLVRAGSDWNFEVLYTLPPGSSGGIPWGGVALDNSGNVFGATGEFGGGVWELSPAGDTWNFSLIVPFLGGLQDSINFGPDGAIYGTNYADGSHGVGSVFKLTNSQGTWTHTIIHNFAGPEGALPLSNVVFDANGNMYGTTTMGGTRGYGTLWQLTPQ